MKITIENVLRTANRVLVKDFTTRPFTIFIRENYKPNPGLIGAEIGVKKADNAINMLKNLNFKEFILIDPFKKYKGYVDVFDDFDTWEITTRKRIRKYEQMGIAKLIKDFSHNAVELFPDCYFDIIYDDSNHAYKYVKQNLELWFPKVKVGGYIGGHDFFADYKVAEAVIDFIREHNLKKGTKLKRGGYEEDWWIKKGA